MGKIYINHEVLISGNKKSMNGIDQIVPTFYKTLHLLCYITHLILQCIRIGASLNATL